MKTLPTILLLLLLPWRVNAQVPTILAGQVEKNPDQPVMLLVYHFDTELMKEVEVIHYAPCQPDRTFRFELKDITRPMTRCRLGFRNEGVPVRLWPGDSLSARFTYGNIDSTVVYTGSHAAENQYLKEYQLNFSNWQRRRFFGEIEGDSTLLPGLRLWYLKKQEYLSTVRESGSLSQSFASQEADRITYEYLNQLLAGDIRHALGDSLWALRVLPELIIGRLDRDSSWLQVPEYRDYVENHLGMQASRLRPENVRLADRLEVARRSLKGAVLTWYSYQQIQRTIRITRDASDKALLKDYFVRNSDDTALKQLLQKQDLAEASSRYISGYHAIWDSLLNIIGLIAWAVVLILLVVVFRFLLSPPNLKNPATQQIVMFLAGVLVCAALYLILDFRPGNRQVAIFRTLTFLGFLAGNAFYIIPKLIHRRKWILMLVQFGFSAVYVVILYILANHQGTHGTASQLFDSWRSFSIPLSGSVILLGSYVLHYLVQAFYDQKSFAELVRERKIEWEMVFHTAFVFFILSGAVISAIQFGLHRNALVSIAGLMVFYLHAFRFVPDCLNRKRILNYLVNSAGVFLLTCLIFYIPERIEFARTINRFGMNLSVNELIVWPSSTVFRGAVILQLLLIAGWIYALVRVELQQKTIGFKLLQKKQAELNQLRSQVNPHFLFNSLNTLYAFALKENNSRTAEYIARLANLMRYLVDDMARETIPVTSEIRYIRDYIDIQIIRCSIAPEVQFEDGIGEESDLEIAPMLMIPFVENAFKHGINPSAPSVLRLSFALDNRRFRFRIENSIHRDATSFYKEKGFGIGIANVRQRLQHQYAGRHILQVDELPDRFVVDLEINLE